MEVKTQASEIIYGKEREQASLRSPEPLQRTLRVLCVHVVGPVTKVSCISEKSYSYALAASFSTQTALFRCQRGIANLRVAGNARCHNILIHDLNTISKDNTESQSEKHFFF